MGSAYDDLMYDDEEREGIAQYALHQALFEHRPWTCPIVLARALDVRVIAAAPRGIHGIAHLDPPTIFVGRRRALPIVAHELGHVAVAWCEPGGRVHDEGEVEDVAARLVVPTAHLRRLVQRHGAEALNRYPEELRVFVRRRLGPVMAELDMENDSDENGALSA